MSEQNPPSSANTNVHDTSLQQHDWDLPGWVPDKPANCDYGYVRRGQTIGSSREGLIDAVRTGSEVRLVWTPETPEPVFPERVPFLVDAFRKNLRRQARNAVLLSGAFVVLGILIAAGFQDWTAVYQNIFFVFGAVGLTEGIWQYARSRNYTQENAVSDASTARFTAWLNNKSLSGYTVTLAACIIIVGLFQFFAEDSINAAGLVKPAVWDGQVWRLFSSTLMHANLTHFWMNFLALIHFAKIVEQTVHRACVPLVFLLTGAVGSIFSVLLYPNSTSVGASGGLMGLLGFITIASYFDKNRYPHKYLRHMIEAIVLVGVLGLFGFAFIDNAAHFGGLVGGLLLGWFFFRKNEKWMKEKLLKLGGVAALIALACVVVFAGYRMLS